MELLDIENECCITGDAVGDVVLPFEEEDWEFGNENQGTSLCSDTNINVQREEILPYSLQQLASYYHNPLLEQSEVYVSQFLETWKDFNLEFKRLLLAFKKVCEVVLQLQKCNEEKGTIIHGLCQWVFDTESAHINAEGYCQDQRKVSTVHQYNTCRYNEHIANDLLNAILDCQNHVTDDTTVAMYTKTLTRLQCEQFLYGISKKARYHSHHSMKNQDPNKSTTLLKLSNDSIEEVRRCINTMFYFVRRDDFDINNYFFKYLRNWIQHFVCLLMELASMSGYENLVREELYLVSHIIKCPPNTLSWAGSFIQITDYCGNSSKRKLFLDHVIHLLFMILRAPKTRGESQKSNNRSESECDSTFVTEFTEYTRSSSGKWVFPTSENDMVSLYQQIPFEKLLMEIFSLKLTDGFYYYSQESISSEKFIAALACCDVICDVLGEALITFGTPKFKQLVRRIAQSLRNIVLLTSEYWVYYQESTHRQVHSDERLQAEFDEFVKRCVEKLLPVARLGVYQFLADLPFKNISGHAAEVLYVLLNVPAGSRAEVDQLVMMKYTKQEWLDFVEDSDTKLAFEDRLSDMPENEIVYLLTTLSNLACAQPSTEDHLINTITIDIYMVSFVYSSTKDICSKMGRELLYTVTSVHPFVISTLLQRVFSNYQSISSASFYAMQNLPFNYWVPTKEALTLLRSSVLGKSCSSISVRFVKSVLDGMNWGFCEEGSLFLPHSLHCEVALMLLEICLHYELEKQQFGILAKSIDQVSWVASVVQTSPSVKENFRSWIWDMLFKLKLNRSQLHSFSYSSHQTEPTASMDFNDSSLLRKSNAAKLPESSYITIMMTNVGHSLNVFLQHGLPLLRVIAISGNKNCAMNSLIHIIPMFIQGNVDMTINAGFISILQKCLCTGNGVINGIVGRLVRTKNEIPQHLKLLMGSLANGLSKMHGEDNLLYWMKLILAIPSWWEDSNCKIVLDFILECAFSSSKEYLVAVTEILISKHSDLMTQLQNTPLPLRHQNRSLLSSFLGFIETESPNEITTFLNDITADFTYLTYFLLIAETSYENESELWSTVLRSMVDSSVESSLKKAVSQLRMKYAPTIFQLTIYRWARLALLTPNDHPILPAICQRFFQRFIFIEPHLRLSMGIKFFSYHDNTILKDLKIKFSVLSSLQNLEGTINEQLLKLYRAFDIWLDEEKLHDSHLYVPSLPSHYKPELLASIRIQEPAVWSQFIKTDTIRDNVANFSKVWVDSNAPKLKKFPSPSPSLILIGTRNQRLSQLLKQFEPPLAIDVSQMSKINSINLVDELVQVQMETLIHHIERDLETVRHYANSFRSSVHELQLVNKKYIELLPDLYSNEEQRILVKIECQSAFSIVHHCAGPAQVQLRFYEKTLNNIVSENVKTNRAFHRSIIKEVCVAATSNEFAESALHIITIVQAMIRKSQTSFESFECKRKTMELGAKLFFSFADMITGEMSGYCPSRHMLVTCLDLLGQVFIFDQPQQALPLLKRIMERPDVALLLLAHFSPAKSCERIGCDQSTPIEFNSAVFVDMYAQVVHAANAGQSSDIVQVLLAKFDIETWCVDYGPPKNESLALMKAIIMGLKSYPKLSKSFVDNGCSSAKLSGFAVQEIIATQMGVLLSHSANQIFLETVKLILDASTSFEIDAIVWETMNNSIFNSSKSSSGKSISHDSASFCIKYLSVLFTDKRNADKNLFQLWEPYLAVISDFIFNLISLDMRFDEAVQESYGMKSIAYHHILTDKIMPLFSSWVTPVKLKEGVTWPLNFNQQTVAAPVFEALTLLVNKISSGYASDIQRIISTLWTFYVDNTLISEDRVAPEYLVSIYQTIMSDLPWENFIPTLTDLDRMMQLCQTKYDCVLHYLCHVFPRINWSRIMQMCLLHHSEPDKWSEHTGDVLSYFLQILLTLCSKESILISYKEIDFLISVVEDFPWYLIGYDQFEYALNIVADHYHITCFIFNADDKRLQSSQYKVIQLLQIASGMAIKRNTSHIHDGISAEIAEISWMKRKSFMHCIGSLIRNAAKTQCPKELKLLEFVMEQLIFENVKAVLDIIELCQNVDDRKVSSFFAEIWQLMSIVPPKINDISKRIILFGVSESFRQLLESERSWNAADNVRLLLISMISSSCAAVAYPNTLILITECCLGLCLYACAELSGKSDVTLDKCTSGLVITKGKGLWWVLGDIFTKECRLHSSIISEICLSEGCLLTLLAHSQSLFNNARTRRDFNSVIALCNAFEHWISVLAIDQDKEPKVLLLIFNFLSCCRVIMDEEVRRPEAEYSIDDASIVECLISIIPVLEKWTLDRVKLGILGSIGIGRASPLSLGYRVSVRAILRLVVLTTIEMKLDVKDFVSNLTGYSCDLRKLPLENRLYLGEVESINELMTVLEEASPVHRVEKLAEIIFSLYYKQFEHFLYLL